MRTFLLSFLACALCAQDPAITPVLKRIRLYPNQAWITREATWNFKGAETRRIRLVGLPPDLDLDRIRVRVEGIPGLKLGNVMAEQETHQFEPDEKNKALAQELKKIRLSLEDLNFRQKAQESTAEALANLKPKAALEARDPSLDPGSTLVLCRQIQERQQKCLQQLEIVRREKSALESRKNAIECALEPKLSHQMKRTSTCVYLELESHQAGQARITLETQTTEARWKPSYEVRLEEGTKRLEMLCYASVSQKSGEDWNGVNLEISNVEPGRSVTLPYIPPSVQVLYEAPVVIETGRIEGRVTDSAGRAVAGANIEAECTTLKIRRRTTSDANGTFRIPLLPPGEFLLRATKSGHPSTSALAKVLAGKPTSLGLQLVSSPEATVVVVSNFASESKSDDKVSVNYSSEQLIHGLPLESTPPSYTDAGELGRAWILDGARDLPTDAIPRRVLLARETVEPSLNLRSVPRSTSTIHLTASASIPAGFPIFPGIPATLFKDAERLGQTGFPRPEARTGATFSFGPLLGLRAQRERIQATVSNIKNGQGRQWTLREQVLVVNDTDQDQTVDVHEPNLKSASDRIRIEPLIDPPAQQKGDQLIWHMKIPAHGQCRIEEAWRIHGPATGSVPELKILGLPVSD